MSVKNIKDSLGWMVLHTAVFVLFGGALFTRCAHTMAPQGGPRDTLPPVMVFMDPDYGTTNFEGKKIFIEFDEYVKLADQQKEFYTSPFMTRQPSLMIRGRGIQIDIRDTLAENTTYSFNFGSSVQDNNEGNPLHGFKYVFSTGDHIDSMVMSAFTVDAYTSDSLSKVFLLFYEASKDSVPDYDSTVFISAADFVGRSQGNGIAIVENLKPIDYRIYALEDNNGNKTYEPGVDRIGFLDGVYNPTRMPDFTVWYDTVRNYMVGEPQLYFRLFMDDQFKRQYLANSTRPTKYKAVLHFGARYPEIRSLEFFNLDSTQVITEYLTPYKDSIALWFNVADQQVPDSIRGELTYLRHDSINNWEETTQPLTLVWKHVETRAEEKERERKEKEREELLARGEEPEPKPNTFKYRIQGGPMLNPERNLFLEFDYPLIKLDTAQISLTRIGDEEQLYRVRFELQRDTLSILRYELSAMWQPDQNYQLEIPSGVFMNIVGETNDTIRSEFTTLDPEKFAVIEMDVVGKTDSSLYILQLIDKSNRVADEIRGATTGKYYFRYVEPGMARIRIIEDDNGNGVWDKGNLIQRRQPERVEMYMTEGGETELPTRSNWEIGYTLDMNKIFEPITMESVSRIIRLREEALMRKLEKEREGNQNWYQQNPQRPDNPDSPGMGNVMNPMQSLRR